MAENKNLFKEWRALCSSDRDMLVCEWASSHSYSIPTQVTWA